MIEQRLLRLRFLLIVMWLAVPLRLAWMQWVERFDLIKHPFNARVEERLAWRGSMVDRNLLPIAVSKSSKRVFPEGALAAHWSGYYSLKYGLAGGERWKHELLRERRGSDGKTSLAGHRLRLSLDMQLQRLMPAWLDSQAGAAMVVDLDSGQVLASYSAPTFEPSRVEVDWNRWQREESAPTLNRPLLGLYPAGKLWRAWEKQFESLPRHSELLMDTTLPRQLDGQWLLSPVHVAQVVLKAGSSLPLSQLHSSYRQIWNPPAAWWKSLPWKHRQFREDVVWRGQLVEWEVQLRGHQLWLALREKNP